MIEALDKFRLDQVGDASVNDDAGVEQQQIVRLVLRREADVGDDQREILLVAADGQDDADVAEAKEQAEPDEPAHLFIGVHKQAGTVNEHGHGHAEQQAERRRGKGAQGKTLEHLVNGNQQPAEAEADGHADQFAVRRPDVFRSHLADSVAARRAEREK